MKESEIIKAIEEKVSFYRIWVVGVTNDPIRRRDERESTKSITAWYHWIADSEQIARKVESFFLKKGMKSGGGGGTNPTYVYIFI